MKINNPEFVISAYGYEDYPDHNKAEIAFAGRSNVGKSSLINMLVRRNKLARTSSTPGRTQSINFYNIDRKFYFVDLPGYGFAKVPKNVKDEWGELINDYLYHRDNLEGIVMIVDSRHKPTSDDKQMLKWIRSFDIPFIIAATKADKLTNNKKKKQEKLIKNELNLSENDNFCLVSAKTQEGKNKLFSFIGKVSGQFK
ncbi:MAG TPA: ribosome biogenesis GTP-binding protein YihA/YsxC [Halanaerobiales bacterium]|nr:ribosome biogenesis GTP-binding protein YihA/YsxC [Halanaerobiales bacterium]